MLVQPTPEFYQYIGITDQKRLDALSQKSKFEQIKDLIANGDIKMDRLGIKLENCDDIIYFNFASTGNGKLTEEQAEYLRQTYDMNNINQEQYMRMLADLSNFGVIDGRLALGEAHSWLKGISAERASGSIPQGIDDWLRYFIEKAAQMEKDISWLNTSNADIAMINGTQNIADFHAKMAEIMRLVSI